MSSSVFCLLCTSRHSRLNSRQDIIVTDSRYISPDTYRISDCDVRLSRSLNCSCEYCGLCRFEIPGEHLMWEFQIEYDFILLPWLHGEIKCGLIAIFFSEKWG